MSYVNSSYETMSKRYLICLIISLIFFPMTVTSTLAATHDLTSAYYCSSDEIPFIGELIPSMASIVESPKAKSELGLTSAQMDKMRDINKYFSSGIKSWFAKQNDSESASPRNGKAAIEHVMELSKMTEDARKRTNEVLKSPQMARMKEIMLQRTGLLAVPKKELQQLLRLERSQERAIDEIRSRIFKKIDGTITPSLVIASEGHCKFVDLTNQDLDALLRESEKSVYLLLNSKQKETIEKIKGKPYSF
jgi:hypothetical protein